MEWTTESLYGNEYNKYQSMNRKHGVRVFSLQNTINCEQEEGDPEAESKPEPPLILERTTISIDERLEEFIDNFEPHEAVRECDKNSEREQK